MPEWHASFFIAFLRFSIAHPADLVVKHADIKSVSVVFHIFRFYICVFYHQQLHNCDCLSTQFAYIP